MLTTKCKACGSNVLSKKGGKKLKQYCGSARVRGTCANEHKKQYARERIEKINSPVQTKVLTKYLDTLGGRTIDDVDMDEQGKRFVYMWSGENHVVVRFYLPEYIQY